MTYGIKFFVLFLALSLFGINAFELPFSILFFKLKTKASIIRIDHIWSQFVVQVLKNHNWNSKKIYIQILKDYDFLKMQSMFAFCKLFKAMYCASLAWLILIYDKSDILGSTL